MADTTVKSIKGTRTEKNLVTAYLNESAAFTRYTFYAQQASKEGLFPIEEVFNDTAANEMHHGKVFFKFLQTGENVEVTLNPNAGIIGNTEYNLKMAMSEEISEGVDAYTAAAKVAREEGFDEIASHFEAIAKVEQDHYNRFGRFLKHLHDGTLWKRDEPITWVCLVCGFEYVGKEPPVKCPGCSHPQSHYMAKDEYLGAERF